MKMLPESALKVITDAEIALKQFETFMTGTESVLIINTEEEYNNAAVVIKSIKDHKKSVEEQKSIVVPPLFKTYKDTLAPFSLVLDNIEDKVTAIESAGRIFRKKIEAEAAEKQRLLDVAAAQERKKAEDKAEAERIKADAYRNEGREDMAVKADARADKAEEKADSVVAPIVQANIPQNTRGAFNTRKSYSARISRVADLLEHFKKGVPKNVEAEIQKWANGQARLSGGMASTIPGIEFYEV